MNWQEEQITQILKDSARREQFFNCLEAVGFSKWLQGQLELYGPLSQRLRFSILKRDNFTCQYCGRKAPDVQLEVDHIIPRSRGGTNGISNLITACHDCNRGKHITVLPHRISP